MSAGAENFYADLHLHTNFSDGTFTPEELAARGAQVGLAAMSLTDHDTVEGAERMAAACREHGIEFVTGTELTAELDHTEVHILGYFIDPNEPVFLAALKKFQAVRQNRIHEIVEKLNKVNIPLKAEAVFALANCQSPGRPHVGRALIEAGYCKNMDEAFDRFLKKHRPAHVPKHKISARDAINLIHGAGGLAALAHPGLNRDDAAIPSLVEAGLDGIECFHTKHTPSASQRYLEIASRHGLLVTGGSDCHGYNKGKPLIGTVKLAGAYYKKLKETHRGKSSIPQSPISNPQ